MVKVIRNKRHSWHCAQYKDESTCFGRQYAGRGWATTSFRLFHSCFSKYIQGIIHFDLLFFCFWCHALQTPALCLLGQIYCTMLEILSNSVGDASSKGSKSVGYCYHQSSMKALLFCSLNSLSNWLVIQANCITVLLPNSHYRTPPFAVLKNPADELNVAWNMPWREGRGSKAAEERGRETIPLPPQIFVQKGSKWKLANQFKSK